MTALAVDTPILHQLFVEFLQIVGSQLGELDIADAGNGILLDHQLIAVGCGNSHIRLCIDIIPAPQPCGDSVLIGTADIDTLDRFQRDTQFCLAFRLRLAENIFNDPLASLGVIACGVATLPTPVCAFADVALAVGALFSHL